jgi:hypothetical protein
MDNHDEYLVINNFFKKFSHFRETSHFEESTMNKLVITIAILVAVFSTTQVLAGPYGSLRHGVPSIASIPSGSGLPDNKEIEWLIGKTICFKYESTDATTTECLTVLKVKFDANFSRAELLINDGSFIFTKTYTAGHPTEHSQLYSTATNGSWSRNAEVMSIE